MYEYVYSVHSALHYFGGGGRAPGGQYLDTMRVNFSLSDLLLGLPVTKFIVPDWRGLSRL
jgi:hypothetical protein